VRQARSLKDRVTATAIVNQAALKCLLLGVTVNSDNVIRLIGDFYDPLDPAFAGLTDEIMWTVDEMSELASRTKPDLNS
jgi:hypothetical protein